MRSESWIIDPTSYGPETVDRPLVEGDGLVALGRYFDVLVAGVNWSFNFPHAITSCCPPQRAPYEEPRDKFPRRFFFHGDNLLFVLWAIYEAPRKELSRKCQTKAIDCVPGAGGVPKRRGWVSVNCFCLYTFLNTTNEFTA
jgi:hypothetical protein